MNTAKVKYLLIPLFMVFANKKCNSQKINAQNINYYLGSEIDSLFKNKLTDSSYFCLSDDSDCYDLYIDAGKNYFVDISNRKVFMYGRFYPLMFRYDMDLGSTLSDSSILAEYRKEYIDITKLFIIHEGFHVRFKKYGDHYIVSSGWAIAKKADKKN